MRVTILNDDGDFLRILECGDGDIEKIDQFPDEVLHAVRAEVRKILTEDILKYLRFK
jgi:hypothetical protein